MVEEPEAQPLLGVMLAPEAASPSLLGMCPCLSAMGDEIQEVPPPPHLVLPGRSV